MLINKKTIYTNHTVDKTLNIRRQNKNPGKKKKISQHLSQRRIPFKK